MKSITLAIPPLDEQRAIADFLDRETARIDTLIAKQEQLIASLSERRSSVVEDVVFGGLSDAPKAENPEQWLPPTPTPWPIVQLGFITDTIAGWAFPSDGFSKAQDSTRLLRGINIKPGRTDWRDVVYWDETSTPVPHDFHLKVGDLVLGMDRPFVSDGVRITSIIPSDLPALLLQRVMRLRPLRNADPSYVRYVVMTTAFLAYLEPLFTGVSVPHVSEWQVRKFKLPLPPLHEQRAIVAHLDEQTAKIDALIEKAERFIELSKERRSALITAAVTGQLDVRGQVA